MIRVKSCWWGHIDKDTGKYIYGKPDKYGHVSIQLHLINYGDKAVKKVYIYCMPWDGARDNLKKEPIPVKHADGIGAWTEIDYDWLEICYDNFEAPLREFGFPKIEVTYEDGTTEVCNHNYEPTDAEKKEWERIKAAKEEKRRQEEALAAQKQRRKVILIIAAVVVALLV